MLPLPTQIIPGRTCLIRSSRDKDKQTNERFFGYFGQDRDLKKFTESKSFIQQYITKGHDYQFYKIIKPINLLLLPYLHLGDYDENDELVAGQMAETLVKFVLEHPELQCIKKYGKKDLISSIFDVLIPFDVGNEALSPKVLKIRETSEPSANNPDYLVAALICEMGFKGWVRMANIKKFTKSDEIYFCDIEYLLKNGYVKPSRKCNLSNQNKSKRQKAAAEEEEKTFD